jgi:hypothetical protein
MAGKVLECSRQKLTKRDKRASNSSSVKERVCTCLIAMSEWLYKLDTDFPFGLSQQSDDEIFVTFCDKMQKGIHTFEHSAGHAN